MGVRYPQLAAAYRTMHLRSNESRDAAFGRASITDLNIATISTGGIEHSVGRTTMDRNQLVQGAYLLGQRTYSVFGEETESLEQSFAHFREGRVPAQPPN
jgi:hypothetical protein